MSASTRQTRADLSTPAVTKRELSGIGGYLLKPTTLLERVALVAAGLLLLAPGAIADLAGLALFAAGVGSQLLRVRPVARPQRV